MYLIMKCKECDSINEIHCDGDNPMFCPDCRSCDTLTDADDEE